MTHHHHRQIIAHHLIFTLYGHWGVNDPRGSGSTDFIADKFATLGPIHHGRQPSHLQPNRDELHSYHDDHSALLNFPVLWLDEAKRQATTSAFAAVIQSNGYTCYAAAFLSNHAHLLIRVHRDDAAAIWNKFADQSRARLCGFADIAEKHPVWSARPYKVFLNTPDDVRRTCAYINQNPEKENLPTQHHPFITPYNNWPFHKNPTTPPQIPPQP